MNNSSLVFFDKYIKGKSKEIYDYEPIIGETGDFRKLQGIDVSVNQIRNLLLTPLGYYPFDPNFGSLLYKQVFEPADGQTENVIRYECNQRIMQYVPNIKIEKVDVFFFPDSKGFKVDVYIDKQGVKGKVSLVLPSQQTMFGLDDSEFYPNWKRGIA